MPFSIDHEQESSRIWQDESYAKQINTQLGISNLQLEALRLLSMTDLNHQYTDIQKHIVQRFLIESMGDQQLNRCLKQMQQGSLKGTGLDAGVLGNMIYFSYKTRRVSEFPQVFDKINKNQNRIVNQMNLDENSKISLKEYSIFTDLAKMEPVMNELQKKVGFEGNKLLQELHQKIMKAAQINKAMEAAYEKSIPASPGMLSFDNTKKKAMVLGKKLTVFDNIVRKLITSHGHAGKLYENKKREAILSHINPYPLEDKYALKDFLYSDVYQIKIDKLIAEKNQKALKEMYGVNWLEIVNTKYAKIERQIHDNAVQKFAKLTTLEKMQHPQVGIRSMLPLSLGHKKIKKTDFSKIHREMIEGHYKENKGRMLCSEFVATSTIAALKELDNQLKAEASFKGRKLSGKVVQIPISKRENLHAMVPDRLLSILKSKGCVERIEHPAQVKRYIKT